MSVTTGNYNLKMFNMETLAGRPIVSTLTYSVGEMLYLSGGKYRNDISDAQGGAQFAGICLDEVPTQSINDRKADTFGITVGFRGVYKFHTTAMETYTEGTSVHVGANAKTISTTGSNVIGVILMPQNTTSVTGAAGTDIEVLITSKVFANA